MRHTDFQTIPLHFFCAIVLCTFCCALTQNVRRRPCRALHSALLSNKRTLFCTPQRTALHCKQTHFTLHFSTDGPLRTNDACSTRNNNADKQITTGVSSPLPANCNSYHRLPTFLPAPTAGKLFHWHCDSLSFHVPALALLISLRR